MKQIILSGWLFAVIQIIYGHHGHDHGSDELHIDFSRQCILETPEFKLQHVKLENGNWTARILSPATGYAAVGFCSAQKWENSMKGCDIIMAARLENKSGVIISDYHATGNSKPILDHSNDVQLLTDDNLWAFNVTFERPIDTGDKDDVSLDDDVYIIYAYSEEKPKSPSDFVIHRVTSRGHTETPVRLFYRHGSNQAPKKSILTSLMLLPVFIALKRAF